MRLVLASVLLALAACSPDPTPTDAAADNGCPLGRDGGCLPSESRDAATIDRAPGCPSGAACTCADGASGQFVCFWDGGYACACGADAGMDVPDVGQDVVSEGFFFEHPVDVQAIDAGDAVAAADTADAMVCDTGPCTCPDGRSGNYTCLSEWCVCTGPLDAGADITDVPADRPDVVDVPRDALPDACASTTVGNCCGVACGALPNATGAVCLGGRCGYGACAMGYADCDGDAANGCEINLRSSAANCGACGAPCAAGRACTASACVACPSGQTVCGDRCVNLRTAADNCGACGVVCPTLPNAFPGCVAGACVVSCQSGFADCNDMDADGCETNSRTDRLNCGSCGRACSALQTCRDSVCVIL